MNSLRLALCVATLVLAASASGFETAQSTAATGTIEYAFTPGDDAAGLVVRTIDAARAQVLVQAFSFTHRDIADALIRAHRRGLDVQIIADREQSESTASAAMHTLINSGLPVYMDAEHSAAHNKVLVIDHGTSEPVLVTGSFNFKIGRASCRERV